MNNEQLHLIINHLPITFIVLGFIVMIFGFIFKSDIVKRIAYMVFILGALFGFASFYTGENAKQFVKGIKEFDERLLSQHEESALAFLSLLYILGVISIFGLWANWQKKGFSKIIAFITIGFLLVVLYYGIQAGLTGGEIRHSEITKISNIKNT